MTKCPKFRPFPGLARDLEIGHKLPQFCEVLRGKCFTVCNICTQETLHSWNKWRHIKEMLLACAFAWHTRTLTVRKSVAKVLHVGRVPRVPCQFGQHLKFIDIRWHMLGIPWNPEEHQLGEQANSDPVCPVCFALRPRLFQSKVFATFGTFATGPTVGTE